MGSTAEQEHSCLGLEWGRGNAQQVMEYSLGFSDLPGPHPPALNLHVVFVVFGLIVLLSCCSQVSSLYRAASFTCHVHNPL